MNIKFKLTLENEDKTCNIWIIQSDNVCSFLNYRHLLEDLSIPKKILDNIIKSNNITIHSFTGTLTFKTTSNAETFLKEIEPIICIYLLNGVN